MTEPIPDLTFVPANVRFCLSCKKRLAAMNAGHHCFTCEAAFVSKVQWGTSSVADVRKEGLSGAYRWPASRPRS